MIIILYRGSVNCGPQTRSSSPPVFMPTRGYSSPFKDLASRRSHVESKLLFLFPDASSTLGPKAFAVYSSSRPLQIFRKSRPSVDTLLSVLWLLGGGFPNHTRGKPSNVLHALVPLSQVRKQETRALGPQSVSLHGRAGLEPGQSEPSTKAGLLWPTAPCSSKPDC